MSTVVRRVAFERVAVREFRNLALVDFEPASRLNVISGSNGHGKTSLIEALYLVATSKSFRAERVLEVIRQGAAQAIVRATVRSTSSGSEPTRREQRAVIGPRARSFLIDGKKPARRSSYAIQTPIIAFHPGDLELVGGPASRRRTLLDRVALYLDPPGADARLHYQKALRDRQRLLALRGPRGADLDAYEQVLAEHGARFARARERTQERLVEALLPAFERMAAPGLELEVTYRPGGTTDAELFLERMRDCREKDLRRGAANFGPQRDELELVIAGRPARSHASQGQQRVMTLALKIAELDCVREASGAQPVLLLDDVSSELDADRTSAVFSFLRETESQVFVTTTRPELFEGAELPSSERANFALVDGSLEG